MLTVSKTTQNEKGRFDGLADSHISALPRVTRTAQGMAHLWRELKQAAAETLWTTRCVICDTPGKSLCDRCRRNLPYVDRWLACPRCGAPQGRLQCAECNSYTLDRAGREKTPFTRCVSAVRFEDTARSVVLSYKDAGERALAHDIARILCDSIPYDWPAKAKAVTFIPSDVKKRRQRGFDHMAPIAAECAEILGLPCRKTLAKRPSNDQRGLTRLERFANMADAFTVLPDSVAPGLPFILIDDVYTTGATLYTACDALVASGGVAPLCATFARVP